MVLSDVKEQCDIVVRAGQSSVKCSACIFMHVPIL